ncbi:histone H1-like [Tripterygium wilfordii]|uniref:Histone H1-like n=1 Tax=Tripterygium wilfordii TaxID=458696 RepID=A0A7J7E1F7_TRIWF|nr:histone H1.1-like [Tripterygium wilfordii]KAF5752361.1 histone H1-like [Tripterygium wilfordii]
MTTAALEVPAPAKTKASKGPNSKKTTTAVKKPRSHPPYSEMIKEAIMVLKERTGSSRIAIAKFIEEKQKPNLPPNFKKLLLVQLKKLVAAEKLIKVKNSFKLPPKSTATSDAKNSAPAKPKTASKARTKADPKAKAEAKPKTGSKAKIEVKAKADPKPKVVAKAKVDLMPKLGKRKAEEVKSPVKKVKKTTLKGAKKPKSIKSPVKKVKKN